MLPISLRMNLKVIFHRIYFAQLALILQHIYNCFKPFHVLVLKLKTIQIIRENIKKSKLKPEVRATSTL